MKHQEPELKAALNKLDKLLTDYPDSSKAFIPYKNYLKTFLRVKVKSVNLPTSEVMAVIKHERPNITYLLKKQSMHDPTLYFLTNIEMDYEKANKKLSDVRKLLQ